MKTITINSQIELDALPLSFEEFTSINIKGEGIFRITKTIDTAIIKTHNNVILYIQGSNRVEAKKNTIIYASQNTYVEAYDNAKVWAYDNVTVEAFNDAIIYAYNKAYVYAYNKANVISHGDNTIMAYNDAKILAYHRTNINAFDRVVVKAYNNTTVEAYGKTTVEAYDNTFLKVISEKVTISKLCNYVIIQLIGIKIKIKHKDKTVTVIRTPDSIKYSRQDFFNRCEFSGKDAVILYKSVNPETLKDFRTDSIKYVGIIECQDWDSDKTIECGNGFHLCYSPELTQTFNQGKILKCRVLKKDIVIYPYNLNKCRCKRVEVLEEK